VYPPVTAGGVGSKARRALGGRRNGAPLVSRRPHHSARDRRYSREKVTGYGPARSA